MWRVSLQQPGRSCFSLLSLSHKIHLVYVASVFPGDDLNAGCEIAINCNAACLLSKMKHFKPDFFFFFFPIWVIMNDDTFLSHLFYASESSKCKKYFGLFSFPSDCFSFWTHSRRLVYGLVKHTVVWWCNPNVFVTPSETQPADVSLFPLSSSRDWFRYTRFVLVSVIFK